MTRKHLLIMLLCCLIPVGVFFVLLILNVPLNTALLVGMIILCPLLHLVMMAFMHQPGGRDIGTETMSDPMHHTHG